MAKIQRPQSLNELVLDQLRRAIVSGDYRLGEPLSEAKISADLGTSKGPVRRAIVQLQMEGLVRVVPQSGTFVFSMSSEEIQKLNECRLILEEAALRLAMSHDREVLAGKLVDTFVGMTEARGKDDTRRYLELDTLFHDAIFVHCDNDYLCDAYRLVSGKSAVLRTHLAVKPKQTSLSFEEHGVIARAVRDDDLKLALRTLRTHIGRAPKTYSKDISDIAEFDRSADVS